MMLCKFCTRHYMPLAYTATSSSLFSCMVEHMMFLKFPSHHHTFLAYTATLTSFFSCMLQHMVFVEFPSSHYTFVAFYAWNTTYCLMKFLLVITYFSHTLQFSVHGTTHDVCLVSFLPFYISRILNMLHHMMLDEIPSCYYTFLASYTWYST